MKMKHALTYMMVALTFSVMAISFENINFNTELDVGNMTNLMSTVEVDGSGNMTFKQPGMPSDVVEQGKTTLNDNMVFHQLTG